MYKIINANVSDNFAAAYEKEFEKDYAVIAELCAEDYYRFVDLVKELDYIDWFIQAGFIIELKEAVSAGDIFDVWVELAKPLDMKIRTSYVAARQVDTIMLFRTSSTSNEYTIVSLTGGYTFQDNPDNVIFSDVCNYLSKEFFCDLIKGTYGNDAYVNFDSRRRFEELDSSRANTVHLPPNYKVGADYGDGNV